MGAKVVLALVQTIPEMPLTAIYCDNFFTSLELFTYLRSEYGVLAVGTIRSNRLKEEKKATKKKKKV